MAIECWDLEKLNEIYFLVEFRRTGSGIYIKKNVIKPAGKNFSSVFRKVHCIGICSMSDCSFWSSQYSYDWHVFLRERYWAAAHPVSEGKADEESSKIFKLGYLK